MSTALEAREILSILSPDGTADASLDPNLPDATRLWALLQQIGGGTWAGCVYDVNAVEKVIAAGLDALKPAGSGKERNL